MLDVLSFIEKQYLVIERNLDNGKLDYLKLTYKDDIESDPLKAYRKICEFCAQTPIPVEVLQQKIAKKDFLDELNNPELLVNYLRNTPYEWMLA